MVSSTPASTCGWSLSEPLSELPDRGLHRRYHRHLVAPSFLRVGRGEHVGLELGHGFCNGGQLLGFGGRGLGELPLLCTPPAGPAPPDPAGPGPPWPATRKATTPIRSAAAHRAARRHNHAVAADELLNRYAVLAGAATTASPARYRRMSIPSPLAVSSASLAVLLQGLHDDPVAVRRG